MAKNTRSQLDLHQSFDEYFDEIENFGTRGERFYEDVAIIRGSGLQPLSHYEKQMKRWLKAAYIQGARAMAQDTLDTLSDYGTACAGVDKDKYSLTDCFDKAHANLHTYYTQVLQDAEDTNR